MIHLLFTTLLLGNIGQAYNCPATLQQQTQAQETHAWLDKFAGQFELHGCQVEITRCTPSSKNNEGAPIGEIFLQTPDGREAYVSVDFAPHNDLKLRTQAHAFTRALNYERRDLYFEEINGRTEFWQLELHTLWEDTDTLDVIDLGIYTTNSQLNQRNGNQSHWFNCRDKEDAAKRRSHKTGAKH